MANNNVDDLTLCAARYDGMQLFPADEFTLHEAYEGPGLGTPQTERHTASHDDRWLGRIGQRVGNAALVGHRGEHNNAPLLDRLLEQRDHVISRWHFESLPAAMFCPRAWEELAAQNS